MSHHSRQPPNTAKLFSQFARLTKSWSEVIKSNLVEILRPSASMDAKVEAVHQIAEVARQMELVAVKADTATATTRPKEHV